MGASLCSRRVGQRDPDLRVCTKLNRDTDHDRLCGLRNELIAIGYLVCNWKSAYLQILTMVYSTLLTSSVLPFSPPALVWVI